MRELTITARQMALVAEASRHAGMSCEEMARAMTQFALSGITVVPDDDEAVTITSVREDHPVLGRRRIRL